MYFSDLNKVTGVLIISLVFIVPKSTHSLYVHLQGSDRKCFIDEIPNDTMVAGNLKLELELGTQDVLGTIKLLSRAESTLKGLHVEVMDPTRSIILSKLYTNALQESRVTFTSYMAGEHMLCFNLKWNRLVAALGKYRLHMDIQKGGHAMDYDVVSKKEKLTEIQLKIRKLLDHADQIKKEQAYQVLREQRFRQTSESTNRRVLWFAILQTLILIIMGYYHVYNLKNFFLAKKLV